MQSTAERAMQIAPCNLRSRVFRSGPVPMVTPCFTLATIRENTRVPDHLVVLGGGSEACAAAQAYRRLGAEVSLIAPGAILPVEDPDLVALVRSALLEDGIDVIERSTIQRIEPWAGGITVFTNRRAVLRAIVASDVLVANGPSHGNARRRAPRAASWNVMRVTRTDPILAHAGMTQREVRRLGDTLRVLRLAVDRDGGHTLKLVGAAHGAILGVTIVGPHADQLLAPWALAMEAGLTLDVIGALRHAEISSSQH